MRRRHGRGRYPVPPRQRPSAPIQAPRRAGAPFPRNCHTRTPDSDQDRGLTITGPPPKSYGTRDMLAMMLRCATSIGIPRREQRTVGAATTTHERSRPRTQRSPALRHQIISSNDSCTARRSGSPLPTGPSSPPATPDSPAPATPGPPGRTPQTGFLALGQAGGQFLAGRRLGGGRS
jgi:hypothetical protein